MLVDMWDQRMGETKVVESATIVYQVAGTQSISNPAAQGEAFKGNGQSDLTNLIGTKLNQNHPSITVTAATDPDLFELYSSYGSRMCTSRGSDVKSYFRSKLFDKGKVAFESNRMLSGLVNGMW